uniref:alpha-tectorin-like isoform X1 n=1 Tax=Styela clava TaxID=7725 RepID=UPI0019397CCC|nr:alpha-tectorin-like isoform X1 [Styela clava]
MDIFTGFILTCFLLNNVQYVSSACDSPEPPSVDNMTAVLGYLDFVFDCETWVVYVNVSSCKLEKLGLTSIDGVFIDASSSINIANVGSTCQFTLDAVNEVYYAVFNWNECNPTIAEDANFVRTFEYFLHMKLGNWNINDVIIKRDNIASISITCSYLVGPDMTLGAIDPEQVSYQLTDQISTGSYSVRMKAFADSSLTNSLSSDNRLVTVPDFFYIKMVIKKAGVGLILQAEYCWATPTSDSTNSERIDLIVGGCPEATLYADSGVTVTENYASDTVVFGVRSFLWTGFSVSGQEIYVHCSLAFCDSTAQTGCTTQSCSARKKRSIFSTGLRHGTEQQQGRTNYTSSAISPISIAIKDSICLKEPVECEQICTVINGSRACRCYSDYHLQNDDQTCLRKDLDEMPTSTEVPHRTIPSILRKWKLVIENAENIDVEGLKMSAIVVCMFAVFVVLLYAACRYCRTVRASNLENLGNLPQEKIPLCENA